MTEREIVLKTFVETFMCLFYSCMSSAVSDESLAHIISMGFPLDLARNALAMTGENIEEAVNLLIYDPDRWVVQYMVVGGPRLGWWSNTWWVVQDWVGGPIHGGWSNTRWEVNTWWVVQFMMGGPMHGGGPVHGGWVVQYMVGGPRHGGWSNTWWVVQYMGCGPIHGRWSKTGWVVQYMVGGPIQGGWS